VAGVNGSQFAKLDSERCLRFQAFRGELVSRFPMGAWGSYASGAFNPGLVRMFGPSFPELSHPPLRKYPKLDVFKLAIYRVHGPRRFRTIQGWLCMVIG